MKREGEALVSAETVPLLSDEDIVTNSSHGRSVMRIGADDNGVSSFRVRAFLSVVQTGWPSVEFTWLLCGRIISKRSMECRRRAGLSRTRFSGSIGFTH